MAEPFTVHLTKWCLSQGIYEVTAHAHPTNEFWVIIADGGLRGQIAQAGEWFPDRADAVKDAKKRLAKAQASARRYLAELEQISFEEVAPRELESIR